MNLLIESIKMDWPVLTPIFICSILVVAVAINRITYYKKNERNIGDFIQNLQRNAANAYRGRMEMLNQQIY